MIITFNTNDRAIPVTSIKYSNIIFKPDGTLTTYMVFIDDTDMYFDEIPCSLYSDYINHCHDGFCYKDSKFVFDNNKWMPFDLVEDKTGEPLLEAWEKWRQKND